PDNDGDGVPDGEDNCPTKANPAQSDTDGDGIGNACDDDDDGDGTPDGGDNCPTTFNEDQTDTDGDGVGDACDANPNDPDGDDDGVPDGNDTCPTEANPDQTDTDQDGVGDARDADPNNPDDDGDGVPDGDDNCPTTANAGQRDTDGDGTGDACDTRFGCTATYTPIINTASSNVLVDSDTNGICLLCSVRDPAYVIDENLGNAARVTLPVGLGGNGSIRITDNGNTYTDDL